MTPPHGSGARSASGVDVEADVEPNVEPTIEPNVTGNVEAARPSLVEVVADWERFHHRVSRSLATIAQLAAGKTSRDPLRVAVLKGFLIDPLREHLADEEQVLVRRVRALHPRHEVAAALAEIEAGILEIREATVALLPALTDLAAGRRLATNEQPLLRAHVRRLRLALAEHVRLEEDLVFPWVRERARSPC